jgi:bisphosphoglycerate-dependent phosphoglycerate mutase
MDSSSNKHPWEERLHEAGTRIEDEVRRVVRYLDDEVVPEVRRNSSIALRAAADRLAKLAQHLEDSQRKDKP